MKFFVAAENLQPALHCTTVVKKAIYGKFISTKAKQLEDKFHISISAIAGKVSGLNSISKSCTAPLTETHKQLNRYTQNTFAIKLLCVYASKKVYCLLYHILNPNISQTKITCTCIPPKVCHKSACGQV
jgi:hypothetical protein